MKKISSKDSRLKKDALNNASISRRTQDGTEVIKPGVPLDHSRKHPPHEGSRFGVSKGITKNMENYESLRVDIWLDDSVQEGETLTDAVKRVDSILNSLLEECVASVIEEE